LQVIKSIFRFALLCSLGGMAVSQQIVSNPTTSQTINQPAGTSFNVHGATNLFNVSNLNNVLWVDGVNFSTLAACYTALPASGGTCMVPANYSETLNANLTLNKNYAGFIFTGQASINLQTNSIVVSPGTFGAFIDSWVPFGSVLATANTGVVFTYTGNGSAILVGSSSTDTLGLLLRNFMVNMGNSAQTSGVGIDLIRTTRCNLQNVYVNGENLSGRIGIVLDGTGNFTGCLIENPLLLGLKTGLQLTGSSVNAANAGQIIGGNITGGPSGSIGIDFEAGSEGNVVLGTDIEGTSTAVNFGGTSTGNYIVFRSEANTTDVAGASGTGSNMVQLINSRTIPVVNDSGSNSVQSGVQRLFFGAANTFLSGPTNGGGGIIFTGSAFDFYNWSGQRIVSIDVNGSANFSGNLTANGVKAFRINHPLDPEKKYLYHAAVESPDMKNIYDGVVTLGSRGTAVVTLPAYFEALNKDFRYQLACIGGSAPVYIAREIHNNRFVIAGGRPGLKVSWQVTGIRHDAYATAHRMVVEQKKDAEDSSALGQGNHK